MGGSTKSVDVELKEHSKRFTLDAIKPPENTRVLINGMLKAAGMTKYIANFEDHGIVDEQLHLMTDDMLKEMGITMLGDRLYISKVIKEAQRDQAKKVRNNVIWEAYSIRHGEGPVEYCKDCGCCDFLFEPLGFLAQQEKYKLTESALTVQQTQRVPVCLRVCCCAKGKRSTNNLELRNLKDVNSETMTKCCSFCGCGSQTVVVTFDVTRETATEGATELEMSVDDAEKIAKLIRDTGVEMQEMTRS